MDHELGTWLIAGHGSVGAALTRRLDRAGARVLVYDPSPVVPMTVGEFVSERDLDGIRFSGSMSAVPPKFASSAMELISRQNISEGMIFDWNSLPPFKKLALENGYGKKLIDVALLDSIDRIGSNTFVAISGSEAVPASVFLQSLGFDVTVVGPTCGEAARVKMTRSLFMKSLEALVLEYGAIANASVASDTLRRSLEQSLGYECVQFFDLLIRTNRLHAERRAAELAEAVSVFEGEFPRLLVAPAAATFLQNVASAWSNEDSPTRDATVIELADYLHGYLHGE